LIFRLLPSWIHIPNYFINSIFIAKDMYIQIMVPNLETTKYRLFERWKRERKIQITNKFHIWYSYIPRIFWRYNRFGRRCNSRICKNSKRLKKRTCNNYNSRKYWYIRIDIISKNRLEYGFEKRKFSCTGIRFLFDKRQKYSTSRFGIVRFDLDVVSYRWKR